MATKHPIAKLRWQTESGEAEYLLKPEETLTIGREPDNAIAIDDNMVSRHHTQIAWDGEGFSVQDMGSRNGTFVNGQRVRAARRLVDGDEIALHKFCLTFVSVKPLDDAKATELEETIVAAPLSDQPTLIISAGPDTRREILLRDEILTIGRASRNATWQVRLADRTVSRPHARIQRDETGFSIVDLESANGTTVNGQQISKPHPLADGDVIVIGETRLLFRAGSS